MSWAPRPNAEPSSHRGSVEIPRRSPPSATHRFTRRRASAPAEISAALQPHRTASARARTAGGDVRRAQDGRRYQKPDRRPDAPRPRPGLWYKRSRTDRLRYGANRRGHTRHDRMPGAGRCGVYEGSPGTPPVSEQTQWFGIDSRLYDHAGRGYPGITARDPDAQHGALPPQSSSEPPFSRALVPP